MERYELHIELDNEHLLIYRYSLPGVSFDKVIADARAHRKEGNHVILFRENINTGNGASILERVLTFT